jgi:hypothetical protein
MEDWVTFQGKYYQVESSNLYTKPLQPIPVFVAALDKVLFLPASYDPDKQKALESIGFWRGAMVKAFF